MDEIRIDKKYCNMGTRSKAMPEVEAVELKVGDRVWGLDSKTIIDDDEPCREFYIFSKTVRAQDIYDVFIEIAQGKLFMSQEEAEALLEKLNRP